MTKSVNDGSVHTCAAVALTLERGVVDGAMLYRIPADSVKTIYGGFSK